jgi:hypothetical protein
MQTHQGIEGKVRKQVEKTWGKIEYFTMLQNRQAFMMQFIFTAIFNVFTTVLQFFTTPPWKNFHAPRQLHVLTLSTTSAASLRATCNI